MFIVSLFFIPLVGWFLIAIQSRVRSYVLALGCPVKFVTNRGEIEWEKIRVEIVVFIK